MQAHPNTLSYSDKAFAEGLLEQRQRDIAYAKVYLRNGKNRELRNLAKKLKKQWELEEQRLTQILDPQPIRMPMKVKRFPVDMSS